jgi:hypothetical protein
MGNAADFFDTGWAHFKGDPALQKWLVAATQPALATRHDPDQIKDWLRGEGTWFVGVNALGNDATGAINGSGPLAGQAIEFARETLQFGARALDRAQVSICYPGFPKRMKGESDTALAFRINRDGAHVDGLHPSGPDRRRHVEEFAAFLLGLPVTETSGYAAPLVVWEGSHIIMRDQFRAALGQHAPEDWPQIDLTEIYHKARRIAFETCPRRVVHARPGEAYILHRFALHGVAPWAEGASAPPEGRAILYFRPETDREAWLNLP